MIIPLFVSLLLFFCGAFIVIGKRAKADVKNNQDYFLMGRNLGFFGLMMTLLATQLGGGVLLGAAEEAYAHGWQVLLYPLGMAIGLAALGMGFGAKLRDMGLSTISELFEKIYNSPNLRKIASTLSVVSLFFILVAQAIATKKFFISLGIESSWLFVGFWLAFLFYTVLGGLKAVVKTDILQAGFILLVFGLAALFSFKGGAVMEAAPVHFTGSSSWFSWLLMPLLFMLISQDMGQRCFAAKKPKTVTFAALIAAGVLLLASLFPLYFGVMAQKMGLAIPEGASVLMTAVSALTNPYIATLFSFAILLAIVSTADSILCSISSNLALDFTFVKKGSVKASQAITLIVGMAALGLSYFFTSVVGMLIFSYELSVSVLFVPIFMAIIKKNLCKSSAIAAMGAGFGAFLLCKTVVLPFPKELLILALSFGSFFGAEMLTKRALQTQP